MVIKKSRDLQKFPVVHGRSVLNLKTVKFDPMEVQTRKHTWKVTKSAWFNWFLQ